MAHPKLKLDLPEAADIDRRHLFRWIRMVRERGLEALMERGRLGTRPGTRRGLDPAVDAELNAKLEAGEFVTAVQAKR